MFELMANPKDMVDEALFGSSSEKQVAKSKIIEKGANSAEKKEIEAELRKRSMDGTVMSCILTTRDRHTKQLVTQEYFWTPGITTKMPKFVGSLCRPRSDACQSF